MERSAPFRAFTAGLCELKVNQYVD
jgi:hypothetical protein